jgi:hypothetical protein
MIGTLARITVADVKIAREIAKIFIAFICLTNQPICNQKGGGVANKNRCSASDAGNNGDAPRITPKGSRQQCVTANDYKADDQTIIDNI